MEKCWVSGPLEGMMNTDRCVDVLMRKAFTDLKRTFPNGKVFFNKIWHHVISQKKKKKKKKTESFS